VNKAFVLELVSAGMTPDQLSKIGSFINKETKI